MFANLIHLKYSTDGITVSDSKFGYYRYDISFNEILSIYGHISVSGADISRFRNLNYVYLITHCIFIYNNFLVCV